MAEAFGNDCDGDIQFLADGGPGMACDIRGNIALDLELPCNSVQIFIKEFPLIIEILHL